jgi:hypothetical protein
MWIDTTDPCHMAAILSDPAPSIKRTTRQAGNPPSRQPAKPATRLISRD